MMSPGTYLQLRRTAAGLSVLATASALVELPAALRRATSREINRIAEHLHAAEADHAPLTLPQTNLLSGVIALEPHIYWSLLTTHAAGYASLLHICTGCGCTDTMACPDPEDFGSCAWSQNQPDLCTRCEAEQLDALLASVAARAPAPHFILQGQF